jgi:glycerophosphoryl diester phosphodiesterase
MKIFAHRGFSHKYPEATRLAYEKAIAVGAHGLECDVRLTKDREIVCFHDRTLRRIANQKKSVARSSLAQLRQEADAITLEELLDLAIEAKRDLLIETKHPVITGSAIEHAVIKLLNRKQSEIASSKIEVTVMSFSYFAVKRLKRKYKKVMKVIKYSPSLIFRPTKDIAINLALLKKHPGILRRIAPGQAYVWTVNNKADFKWLKKHRISAVITDRPKRASRILLSSRNG